MSYFLEDTLVENCNNDVLIDYTGMNESMLNAELAWSNIFQEAMKNEYQAIKNEDVYLLENAVGDFFTKVKEFFKKMIATIARVVANIKNKILINLGGYKRFAEKAEKVYKKLSSKSISNKKIKYIDVGDDSVLFRKTQEFLNFADKYNVNNTIGTKDNKKSEIAEADRLYNEIFTTIKNAKKIETTTSSVMSKIGKDFVVLKSCEDIKEVLESFRKASKACHDGIKEADKKDKEKVVALKQTASFINQCSSRYLNIAMKLVSIAKSNVKQILSALKRKPASLATASDNELKKAKQLYLTAKSSMSLDDPESIKKAEKALDNLEKVQEKVNKEKLVIIANGGSNSYALPSSVGNTYSSGREEEREAAKERKDYYSKVKSENEKKLEQIRKEKAALNKKLRQAQAQAKLDKAARGTEDRRTIYAGGKKGRKKVKPGYYGY